jgi:hypothetical protein
MSERGLLLGVKCPQSCVEEILQNCQLYLIWPNFQPQIELLCLISGGFWSSFIKIIQNQHTNLQSRHLCVNSKPKCPQFCENVCLHHVCRVQLFPALVVYDTMCHPNELPLLLGKWWNKKHNYNHVIHHIWDKRSRRGKFSFKRPIFFKVATSYGHIFALI